MERIDKLMDRIDALETENVDGGTLTPEGCLIRGDELFHRMVRGGKVAWVPTKTLFQKMREGWRDITFTKENPYCKEPIE